MVDLIEDMGGTAVDVQLALAINSVIGRGWS
jgi:hypothetical protein